MPRARANKPHLLLACLQPPSGGGGAEKQTALIAEGLADVFRISFVVARAAHGSGRRDLQRRGFEVHVLQKGNSFLERRLRGSRLLRLCRELRPDLIYSRFIDFSLRLAKARAARTLRCPLIVQEVNTRSKALAGRKMPAVVRRWYAGSVRRCYPHADLILCNGSLEIDDLCEHFGVPRRKCRYLPNMLAEEDFKVDLSAREPADAGSPLRVLCIGALDPQKDYPTVIRAAAAARRRAALRIDIFGEGRLRGALERRIAEAGVSDIVTLCGFVPNPRGRFEHYDVLLSASLYEGMSNAMLEAMAAGLPAAVSDVCGTRDVIVDPSQGVVFEAGSPEGLADVLVSLAGDRRRLAEFARRGRIRAADFSADRVIEKYRDVFLGLTGKRPLTICAVGKSAGCHVRNRTKAFADRGHTVRLITPAISGVPGVEEIAPNGRRLRLPVLRRLNPMLALWEYYRLIRATPADVVHVHYAGSWRAWLTLLADRGPLVAGVMGSDVLFEQGGRYEPAAGRWLTARLLREADLITVKSDQLRSVVESMGVAPERIIKVVWGLDAGQWRRTKADDLRKQLQLVPGDRVIVSPRSLREFYNIDVIIRAMPKVLAACGSAKLLVTEYNADSAYKARLKTMVEELGLADAVRFVGLIEQDLMPRYYSLAEVAVAMPRTDGLPQSLLEAMACGVANVLPPLPGYREIVADGRSVCFAEPSSDAVADAVVRLLTDDDLRRGIAAEGMRVVAERADFQKEVERLEAELYRLADLPPKRGRNLFAQMRIAANILVAGTAWGWRLWRTGQGLRGAGIFSASE